MVELDEGEAASWPYSSNGPRLPRGQVEGPYVDAAHAHAEPDRSGAELRGCESRDTIEGRDIEAGCTDEPPR